MKRKPVSPLRYAIGIPLVAIGVALFLGGFISMLKGKSTKSSNTSSSSSTAAEATESTSEETKEAEAVKAKPATPTDLITDIIAATDRDISDISVIPGMDGRFKISFYYGGEAWDETRLINKLLTAYVDICKQGYEINGVDIIECFVFADMMDARGNNDKEKVFTISMSKDNFKKYDWGNIAYMPGSAETIMGDCELFDIHAGIQKNVDFSSIYYMGK